MAGKWFVKKVVTSAAIKAVKEVADKIQDNPTTSDLIAHGYGGLVHSIYKHKYTYPSFLKKLGMTASTKVRPATPGQRHWRYWQQPENVHRALRDNFPEVRDWDMLPPWGDLEDKYRGLACHLLKKHKTSARAATALGYKSYPLGFIDRQRIEGIEWSFSFLEQQGRLPRAAECPWWVRKVRYVRGRSWVDYWTPTGLYVKPLARLIRRIQAHAQFRKNHQLPELPELRPILKTHLVALYRLVALSRSSS